MKKSRNKSKLTMHGLHCFYSTLFFTAHAFVVQNNEVIFGRTQRISPRIPSRYSTVSEDSEASGDVHIPKTGVSMGDRIMESQSTQYSTELIPLTSEQPGPAKIMTMPPFQPTRYIVPLYSNRTLQQQPHLDASFVMVDIPPFSKTLVEKISSFIGDSSRLVAIVVTSRDTIHYDQSPAVYVTRKSDIQQWRDAFPGASVIMYRLDTPRDCRDSVTQQLDGYGPWAYESSGFVETGRPLTRLEWSEGIQNKVLDQGEVPPDDNDSFEKQEEEDLQYSPEAIKQRERNKSILAVYTPGHTFGSVVYIFPDTKICCSGYTLPLEDNRSSLGVDGVMSGNAGPMLDYRGYLATNKASVTRQVESGRHVIRTYGDRFHTILPSIGKALFLHERSLDERQGLLLDALDEWQELGNIYQELGIV